jgi:hypothetical protein
MQQLDQRRASALQGYQQSLQQPASGNFSPSEQMLYSWINSLPSPYAVYKGIAAGGQQIAHNEAARVQGNIAANKAEYEDAKDLSKLGVSELLAMRSLAGSKATGKFIQFHDDKGNLYIMNNATGEKQVIPASGAPLWQKVQTTAYEKAVSEGMANPEDYAVEVANRMVESSPAGFTSADTQKPPVVGMGSNPTPTPVPQGGSPISEAPEPTPATSPATDWTLQAANPRLIKTMDWSPDWGRVLRVRQVDTFILRRWADDDSSLAPSPRAAANRFARSRATSADSHRYASEFFARSPPRLSVTTTGTPRTNTSARCPITSRMSGRRLHTHFAVTSTIRHGADLRRL